MGLTGGVELGNFIILILRQRITLAVNILSRKRGWLENVLLFSVHIIYDELDQTLGIVDRHLVTRVFQHVKIALALVIKLISLHNTDRASRIHPV